MRTATQPERETAATDELLERLVTHIDDRLSAKESGRLAVRVSREEVRRHLRERYPFDAPRAPTEVFEDVVGMLDRWTEHGSHPMHYGLFRPTVDRASVVADALVALHDPNLATWEFAPAAQEMERHVLACFARRLGFPEDGAHHFTSGGQEANHTAVLVALAARFPEALEKGLRALPGDPVFYVSNEGHHSLDKVAKSTGLGRASRRVIPPRADLKMDVDALEAAIRADRAAGRLPFLVVATAGTTNAGIVDDLHPIADVAEGERLWLHADAAWGGAAVVSDRLRPVLAGIERADSVTFDAHKYLSTSVGAGMYFCKEEAPVLAAFQTAAAYVPPQITDGRTYPFRSTLQWSRRFIGLKVFLMLAENGLTGIARRVEHQAEMGDALRRALTTRGFSIANETPLPVVCFTHPMLDAGTPTHGDIVKRLGDSQTAWISVTRLRERPVLRACITNYETELRHVERLAEAVEEEIRIEGRPGTPTPVPRP
jgi:glutamate/tyrosine decarboxylase-like PLP-dependent enzyme